MIADYHIHTPYCKHAHGTIIEYVENAISKGIKEICFTDHLGRYYLTQSQKNRYWDWGMSEHTIARYLSEIQCLEESYKDHIIIKKGLEIDFIEGAENFLLPIISKYPFDFLLGSVHCLPSFGWKHISNYTAIDCTAIFKEYFRIAHELISSGIFDGIAHIDFIWRYAQWPKDSTEHVFKAVEAIAHAAYHHNVSIEINSNGYLWSQVHDFETTDPLAILLESIAKYSTPITLGSDAHKPDFVGKGFVDMAQTLTQYGINNYSVYTQRKRETKFITNQ